MWPRSLTQTDVAACARTIQQPQTLSAWQPQSSHIRYSRGTAEICGSWWKYTRRTFWPSLAITREFMVESPKVYAAFTLAIREEIEALGQPYESCE